MARMKLLLVVMVATALPAEAQDRWTWPDSSENLEVLPKDFPADRLSAVMRGFTRSLGVRCSYCHVGEEGKPLSTYDFASDENANKERAREMLRMLGSVNDHLKKIEPSGDQRVNMWCHTCHRGRPRPMTLVEELGEVYREDGVEAVLVTYADLKSRFLERGAYDFGERSLNELGYELLEAGDTDGAIAVLKLNADIFPASANVWDSLGEAHMKAGDTTRAKEYFVKSLELDPENENARDMLKQLGEGG
ncbi:MAG TPA: c-type cytochrome [Rhodothermales bacterium]|nr:c-type cytochrome [Rhodothermales bacterium]